VIKGIEEMPGMRKVKVRDIGEHGMPFKTDIDNARPERRGEKGRPTGEGDCIMYSRDIKK